MKTEAYYTVEGIRYDTLESANTIAKRFYKRYGDRRTIEVVAVVVEDGVRHEEVVMTYAAKKEPLIECPDTLDMFS